LMVRLVSTVIRFSPGPAKASAHTNRVEMKEIVILFITVS
jgi:hypothetical protein